MANDGRRRGFNLARRGRVRPCPVCQADVPTSHTTCGECGSDVRMMFGPQILEARLRVYRVPSTSFGIQRATPVLSSIAIATRPCAN